MLAADRRTLVNNIIARSSFATHMPRRFHASTRRCRALYIYACDVARAGRERYAMPDYMLTREVPHMLPAGAENMP